MDVAALILDFDGTIHSVTRHLEMPAAELVVESLEGLGLGEILGKI
ncbi:MAG: hypothetical protein GY719_23490 [bacterium]|nr:hypothetical protein [bacterium]